MIKRIVLALDGSRESEQALPIAEELARATGATITIVHVREMMLAPVVGGVLRRIDEAQLEAAVRANAEALIAHGIDTQEHAIIERGLRRLGQRRARSCRFGPRSRTAGTRHARGGTSSRLTTSSGPSE